MMGLANFLCSWGDELPRKHLSGGGDTASFLVFIYVMSCMVFLGKMFFICLRIKIKNLFIEPALNLIYGTRSINMPNLRRR